MSVLVALLIWDNELVPPCMGFTRWSDDPAGARNVKQKRDAGDCGLIKPGTRCDQYRFRYTHWRSSWTKSIGSRMSSAMC